MSSIVQGCRLVCALLRIKCFQCYKSVCRGPGPPSRPHYDFISVGLSGSGKTQALATLSSEEGPHPGPTNGFAIKAAKLDRIVINVKELGGSDKFRPYWDKYYRNIDGIVFTVDLSGDDAAVQEAMDTLKEVVGHADLAEVPLLVLGTKSDVDGTRGEEALEHLVVAAIGADCRRPLQVSSVNAMDVAALKAIFNRFAEFYEGAEDWAES